MSGTPDSFRGDGTMATKGQLWAQQVATIQTFQKLDVRLGETFDELRQANANTQGVIQELLQDVTAKNDELRQEIASIHSTDRKSTRLNSSHSGESRMPSSAS